MTNYEIIENIIISILISVIVYLIYSFVLWNINCGEWRVSQRLLMIGSILFGNLLFLKSS